MPIFLEKFVLPVLAAGLITVVIVNPFKFDWHQRISLLVCILAAAYFVGYSLYKSKPAPTHGGAPVVDAPKKTGDATTSGAQSPAVTGDKNKIIYDQSPHPEKKPEPPKKE